MDKKIFLQTMKKYDYVLFDTNGLLDDDGVLRFLELVEREAVEQLRAVDAATPCPYCKRVHDNRLACPEYAATTPHH